MNIYRKTIDTDKYFIATYYIETSKTLDWAAWNLAIGQSVGNPNVRNQWETDELFEQHSCFILHDQSELSKVSRGIIRIAFPIINTNWEEDGITQLLVQVMGGQVDIDGIEWCKLLSLNFPPDVKKYFKGPKFGINKIREYTGVYEKPLLGAIIKPKTGITPDTLGQMVQQLVEGGVNFIKEDEILSNPSFCPLEDRLRIINPIIKNSRVIYCYCINSDYPYVIDRVKQVYDTGGNGVHINFWNGLGIYKTIRSLDLPIFVHFQKSGDQVLTNASHRYSIDWNVICQLAGMSGIDFIHAGMWGGYKSDNEYDLKDNLEHLRNYNVMPALSCGMHPGLVQAINKRFGIDYMANVGGAIHGHPWGTLAGVKAMRQAIDQSHQDEYNVAIQKWGLIT